MRLRRLSFMPSRVRTPGMSARSRKGDRALVNGRVPGTQWLRVVLRDGSTGFVSSDRLRKVGSGKVAGSVPELTATATAVAGRTALARSGRCPGTEGSAPSSDPWKHAIAGNALRRFQLQREP